jgi:hypothetical protein
MIVTYGTAPMQFDEYAYERIANGANVDVLRFRFNKSEIKTILKLNNIIRLNIYNEYSLHTDDIHAAIKDIYEKI